MRIRLLIFLFAIFTICIFINSDGGACADAKQDVQQKPIVIQPSPIYTLRVHAIRFSNNDGSEETPTSPQQLKEWVDKANIIFYNSSAGIQLKFDPSPTGNDWETRKNTALNHLTSGKPSTWKD